MQNRREKAAPQPPPNQSKISSFFLQRKQFAQSKSLSDRNVHGISPASASSSSSSSVAAVVAKNKKRKAEEEREEQDEEVLVLSSQEDVTTQNVTTSSSSSSSATFVTARTVASARVSDGGAIATKKRRVAASEVAEDDEDGEDTEEDEEIKSEYEEGRRKPRTSVLTTTTLSSSTSTQRSSRGEEEEEESEPKREGVMATTKSPAAKRASPPNGRRLVHANTVTDLKELKRRSPASVAKNIVAALQSRSPDQARRREEEETEKKSEDRRPEPEVDRSRTRLRREARTEQGHTIQVRHGDITAEVVGAVVNAANSHLAHGGGVAGAIMRAGGREVQIESDRWVRQHGEVPTGEVAVTGPGRMECEFIIHAVGPICFNRENMPKKDRELASAVTNSLLKAEEMGLRSISLPAISSGIFGYPKDRCAEVMFATALSFCKTHPDSTLRVIRFTNWDMETVTIFEEEFNKRFGARK